MLKLRFSVIRSNRLSLCFRSVVVSRKYAPPFATLALVKCSGGLYAGCDNFSRDYALPSGHEVIVGEGWGPSAGSHRARGEEILKTLAVG